MDKEKAFLVRTTGNVVETKSKVFVVKAPAQEIAQQYAAESFSELYEIAGDRVQVRIYRRKARAIMAIVFMLISVFLSFVPWMSNHNVLIIRPDLISCIFALVFYAIFVIRFKGIQNVFASVLDIAFIPIVTLLVSSFLQAILVKKTTSILGIVDFTVDTRIILLIALLFSAFGLKLVSVICMGIILIYSLVNVALLSEAMGPIWGPVYIICAFLGLLAYISIEPTVIEAFPHYKRMGSQIASHLKEDVVQAGSSAKKIKNTIQNNIGKQRDNQTEIIIHNNNEEE